MVGNNEIRMSNDEAAMDWERTVCPPRAGRGKLAIARCDREINDGQRRFKDFETLLRLASLA
jgi:hypothetical protein